MSEGGDYALLRKVLGESLELTTGLLNRLMQLHPGDAIAYLADCAFVESTDIHSPEGGSCELLVYASHMLKRTAPELAVHSLAIALKFSRDPDRNHRIVAIFGELSQKHPSDVADAMTGIIQHTTNQDTRATASRVLSRCISRCSEPNRDNSADDVQTWKHVLRRFGGQTLPERR